MMVRLVFKTMMIVVVLVVAAVVLSACASSKDDNSGPTVLSLDDLATRDAAQTATTGGPAVVTDTVVVTDVPLPLSPTPTMPLPDSAVPPEAATSLPATAVWVDPSTETPTPTEISEQEAMRTLIAQTNTAIATVRPVTETALAHQQATETAIALLTPPTNTPDPSGDPFQVVFYSDRYGSDDLFLLKLNGQVHQLTGSVANEREPSCFPDASSLVYASDATGSFQIYKLALDKTEPVQLTDSAGMNFAPVVSPDGTTIAFVSTRSDGIPTIWLMDAGGGNQRQLTTELGRDTSPSWGPDGRQLLFASDQLGTWDLFMTVLGEGVEGEFPVMPPAFNEGNQVWSHFDGLGERIAYTVWEDLNDPQTADIYLLDFEKPEPVVVRGGEGADIVWSWGDDTHLLASVGGPDDVQIALVDIEKGEAFPLTDAGTFNGGARLCTVDPNFLAPAATPEPSPTPTPVDTPEPEMTFPEETEPAEESAPAEDSSTSSLQLASFSAAGTDLPRAGALWDAAGQRHIIQPGENLLGISEAYGVDMQTVIALNALADPDQLRVGQELMIPVTRTGYRPGGYQHPDWNEPSNIPRSHKRIVVKLSTQRVYVYEAGRLLREIVASTGDPATPTIVGDYRIYLKRSSQTLTGVDYHLPDVPYVMYFFEGYGFHGTYWHQNFGTPVSHGCINLPTVEAKWLYEWADVGTQVLVKL
ncbi:MAG: PD40 domain-containing protein [Anaerolineae bacterium]|nr:PD40 domain-containing protein [Anaerolineae bacterium]